MRGRTLGGLFGAVLAGAILLCAAAASAAIIGVAFDNGNGLPTNWNNTAVGSGISKQNLIDESGNTTNVDFFMNGYKAVAFNENPETSSVPFNVPSLSTLNTFAEPEDANSVTFAQLASVPYKVWVIGLADSFYINEWAVIGRTSETFRQSATGGELTFNGEDGSPFESFESYALLVTPDANGEIRFEWESFIGAGVAGFAIEAVPEPGTAALLALGLAGLGLARRRNPAYRA